MAGIVCLAEWVWVDPQLNVAGITHVLNLHHQAAAQQHSRRNSLIAHLRSALQT
jgi:hypothetical protein